MPVMSVIVKSTVSFRGEGPHRKAAFVEPRPFKANPAVDGEDRPMPDDFVPCKKLCDVLVVGNVELRPRPSGELLPRFGAVRVGDAAYSLTLENKVPGKYPLRPPYLTATAGGDARCGARPTLDALTVVEHEEEFDYGVYQSAHPSLRLRHVPSGGTIVIEGLIDEAERLEIELPQLRAQALTDWAREDRPMDCELYRDTITIDLDECLIDLVWRGFVYTAKNPRHDVDRVIVGFTTDAEWKAEDEAEASFAAILGELPRGRFEYAWEITDVREGKSPPPLDPDDLEMARYETLDQERAPLPTLTLKEHAVIAATLVEEREPRADILKRFGFDELTWLLEERGLGDQLGSLPMTDDEPPQQEYARHFIEAQDALARPEDDRFKPRDYAGIVVGLEVLDPKKVLKDWDLTLGSWMRIDRRWQTRMLSDAGLEREVSDLIEQERQRLGERPEPNVDDEGRISP